MLSIIAGLAFGILFWKDAVKRSALEKQLKEIEEQISVTEKRLQELSELTPEEIAKREAEQEILSAKTATKDVKVNGVEVVITKERKLIKNLTENYSIEVPPNLLIARSVSSDWLELHDPQTMCQGDPSCNPILRIVVLRENIKNIISEAAEYETLNINGEKTYRVTEIIPAVFEGSYYYWSRGDKVYAIRVSSFDEPVYHKYIETFKLK